MALTQNRNPGSKLLKALEASQGPQVSQVTLPCNSLGSIDFSNYPFRVSFFYFPNFYFWQRTNLCLVVGTVKYSYLYSLHS